MAGTPKHRQEDVPAGEPPAVVAAAPVSPDHQRITNILTLVIVGMWIIVTVARIWVPIPQATILDAALPIVISYYFVVSSTKKNGAAA